MLCVCLYIYFLSPIMEISSTQHRFLSVLFTFYLLHKTVPDTQVFQHSMKWMNIWMNEWSNYSDENFFFNVQVVTTYSLVILSAGWTCYHFVYSYQVLLNLSCTLTTTCVPGLLWLFLPQTWSYIFFKKHFFSNELFLKIIKY